MGLVADSLDMLADSFVYLLALFAVGKAIERKKNVAKISGYFQLILAILGFNRSFAKIFCKNRSSRISNDDAYFVLALLGKRSLSLSFAKSKAKKHIFMSVIFTNNDVMINLGVIIAGILVYFTHSKMPDLAIGTLIFILVTRGVFSILKLSK